MQKSLRISILISMIIFGLASCKSSNQPNFDFGSKEEAYDDDQSAQSTLYEVLSIDTISSIARKRGVSPQQIITENNLKKPYILRSGQLLKIPVNTHRAVDNLDTHHETTIAQEVHIAPRTP